MDSNGISRWILTVNVQGTLKCHRRPHMPHTSSARCSIPGEVYITAFEVHRLSVPHPTSTKHYAQDQYADPEDHAGPYKAGNAADDRLVREYLPLTQMHDHTQSALDNIHGGRATCERSRQT